MGVAGRAVPSVRRNVVANYIGSGWNALMSIAFLPLYISYLGMEAYGLIAVFATLQAWLSLIDTGLAPTLNREMARFRGGKHSVDSIRDLLRSLEFIYLPLGVLVTIGVALAAPWLATGWLDARELSVEVMVQALALMGLLIGLRWFSSLYRSAVSGLQEQVWLNVGVVVFATLRGAGAVAVLAWVSPTIQAFFIYQAVIGSLEAATLAVMAYLLLPSSGGKAKFSGEALQRIWKFAGGMMMITFLAVLLTQVDKVLLSGLVPLEEFGHYALAGVVAGALYLFAGPIGVAVGPRLAELVARNDLEAQTATYHTYAQLLAVIVAPAAVVLAFFSDSILLLWTGDAALTAEVAPLLSLLVIGTMLNALMQLPYALTLAYGWTRFTIATNACAVAILVPAIFFVVPRYGTIGAATVWLTLNAGYVVLAIPFLHRRLLRGDMRRWYLADTLLPLSAALIAVGVARLLVPRQVLHPIESVLILVIVAFVVQMSALLATTAGRRLLHLIWNECRGRFAS